MADWRFITNHGLVLIYIAGHAQPTAREIASAVNITERSVHRILDDLQAEGYLQRQRLGRGNIYQINPDLRLRHDLTQEVALGELLKVLSSGEY